MWNVMGKDASQVTTLTTSVFLPAGCIKDSKFVDLMVNIHHPGNYLSFPQNLCGQKPLHILGIMFPTSVPTSFFSLAAPVS
jgi:hypothetical protein